MPEISSIIQRRVEDDDKLDDSLRRLALDGSGENAGEDKADIFKFPEVPTFAIPALTMTFNVQHQDFNLVKAEIARRGATGEPSFPDSEPILVKSPEEYLLGIGASSTLVLLGTPNEAREERPPGTRPLVPRTIRLQILICRAFKRP
jgi:hypothetical protein